MKIAATNYDLGHDFKIREMTGASFRDTGILGYYSPTKNVAGERDGFSLALIQMSQAVSAIEKAYPGSKGKLALVSGGDVDASSMAQLGGGYGGADWWITYAGRVAFHPLAVRLMEYKGRVDFDAELNDIPGGLLAELK